MDTRCFQDISFRRYQSDCRSHPYKTLSSKTHRKITITYSGSPPNHIIYSLINSLFNSSKHFHSISLKSLTSRQRSNIKGHLVDSNNKAYGIFPFFFPLHLELSPDSRIIDNFSDWISFNLSIRNKINKTYCQQLDNMVFEASSSSSTTIVILDTNIKNNIATSISYMYIANQLLIKMLHYTVFVMTTKAELFAIRHIPRKTSLKLLLSPIPSMWLRKYLT